MPRLPRTRFLLPGALVALGVAAAPVAGAQTLASASTGLEHSEILGTSLVSAKHLTDTQDPTSYSQWPSITADGRYIVFHSTGALVAADTNGLADIYMRDRVLKTTTLVSVAADGSPGNGPSTKPRVSDDARYVVYECKATNFFAGSPPGVAQILVKDLETGALILASKNLAGMPGDGTCGMPSISSDGGVIGFHSAATDLVAGDANAAADAFLYDLAADQVTHISRNAALGTVGEGHSIVVDVSPNGKVAAYQTLSQDLLSVDVNNNWDIIVYDVQTGSLVNASTMQDGSQGTTPPGTGWVGGGSYRPSLSFDGRFVAWESEAVNFGRNGNVLSDVFAKDLQKNILYHVSTAPNGEFGKHSAGRPRITPDGRYVQFISRAWNFVHGDTNGPEIWDVFIKDLKTKMVKRVNLSNDGAEANRTSWEGDISADGRIVVYESHATNLLASDLNGNQSDIFMYTGPSVPWTDLGGGTSGSKGTPVLGAAGPLVQTAQTTFTLGNAAPYTPGMLALTLSVSSTPTIIPFTTDHLGRVVLEQPWPMYISYGLTADAQAVVLEANHAHQPVMSVLSNTVSCTVFDG